MHSISVQPLPLHSAGGYHDRTSPGPDTGLFPAVSGSPFSERYHFRSSIRRLPLQRRFPLSAAHSADKPYYCASQTKLPPLSGLLRPQSPGQRVLPDPSGRKIHCPHEASEVQIFSCNEFHRSKGPRNYRFRPWLSAESFPVLSILFHLPDRNPSVLWKY